MLHFNVSFLRGLRNQHFPEVINEICSIYSPEQIEELYVKESLERLIASDKELKSVMEKRTPHPLTAVLEFQCLQRKEYLVSLRNRVIGTKKSPIKEERESADILFLWLNKHRHYIYSTSMITQNRLVTNLQTDLVTNTEIGEALVNLNLISVFDYILSLTNRIKIDRDIRYRDKNDEKIKSIALRDAAYKELLKFTKALETACNLETSDETFYADYAYQIAVRLSVYRTSHLARRTRMHNNKEAQQNDSNEEEINEEIPTSEKSDPNQSSYTKSFTHNAMDKSAINDLPTQSENGNVEQKDVENEQSSSNGEETHVPATTKDADNKDHSGMINGSDQLSEDTM